jgi:hypothetical protein
MTMPKLQSMMMLTSSSRLLSALRGTTAFISSELRHRTRKLTKLAAKTTTWIKSSVRYSPQVVSPTIALDQPLRLLHLLE